MLPRLFRRSRKPQRSPVPWQLVVPPPPARDRLEAHNATIAALETRIDDLARHHSAAEVAEAELCAAQAAREALADREAERYRAHVAEGGPAPEPLIDERAEVARRIDEARSAAEQARARSLAVRPLTTEAQAQLTALHQKTYSLICAELLEEADEISQAMYRAFAEAAEAEAKLLGIRDAFQARSDGTHAVAIDGILAGGTWPDPHYRREEMRKRAEQLRKSYAKLADEIEAETAKAAA